MKNKKKQHKAMQLPENYFTNFQDKLFERLEVDTSFLPQTDGFIVPKGYFDSLEDRIAKNVFSTKKQGKIVNIKPLYYLSAVAASIVLLISLGVFNKKPVSFDTVAVTEIEEYIQFKSSDISTLDLANLFNEKELEQIQLEQEVIDEENMVEYLSNEIDALNNINLTDTN